MASQQVSIVILSKQRVNLPDQRPVNSGERQSHGLARSARATSEAGRAGQRLLLPAGLLAAAGLATVDARGVRVVAKGGAACIGVDEPGP